MFCKYCGEQIDDSSVFCPYCGRRQKDPDEHKGKDVSDSYGAYDYSGRDSSYGRYDDETVIAGQVRSGGGAGTDGLNDYNQNDQIDFDRDNQSYLDRDYPGYGGSSDYGYTGGYGGSNGNGSGIGYDGGNYSGSNYTDYGSSFDDIYGNSSASGRSEGEENRRTDSGGGYILRPINADVYIKTVPSAVLMVIKLLEGIAAAAALAGMIIILVRNLGGTFNIVNVLQNIINSFDMEGMSDLSDAIGNAGIMASVVFIAAFALSAFAYVLRIVDAAGACSLRIRSRGAGMMKNVHFIYVILRIAAMVLATASLVGVIILIVCSDTPEPVLPVMISAVVYVITLFILLIIMNYDRDIVSDLKTVDREIIRGERTKLRRTHLTAICVFFIAVGVAGLICILTGNAEISLRNSDLPFLRYAADYQTVICAVCIGILILKYVMVMICHGCLVRCHTGRT